MSSTTLFNPCAEDSLRADWGRGGRFRDRGPSQLVTLSGPWLVQPLSETAMASPATERGPLPEFLEPVQDYRDIYLSARARCGRFGHQETSVDR